MAAGVGKTYRMLLEGRQAADEGQDVVIGYLEPHDRPETTALADGLELVPRLRAQHGALELEEMDLDAVLARAPALALIDELAHTNAPGLRHEKRWQDIEDVLAAGIDVISTVNVQHLESLNDAIFELTDVRVRETFPDHVLDEADEVVLVDLSPEELQERLRAGKVYPKERAAVAIENFFRSDKLAVLRELALREVAEDVEAKRDVAVQWCGWATEHAQSYGGKPWRYALIPHDASKIPNRLPSMPSVRLSTSSCRAIRPRPAPSAIRMVNS